MIDFLIDKFIKNTDGKSEKEIRKTYGKFSSLVGLSLNLFLVIFKLLVGFLSNSIAIIGEGLNHLSDSISSVITLVSFKLSGKPADDEHPFGHARYEYVLSSIVAMLILYIAITLFVESFKKVLHPNVLNVKIYTILVLVISIFVKFWMYLFYNRVDKRIDSQIIRARALDSKSDILATSAVLTSTLIYRFFEINFDGYIGLLVSIMIMKQGFELLIEVVNKIIGYRPDEKEVDEILSYYLKHKRIKEVHDLMFHDYGADNIFISIHVEMDSHETLKASHALVDEIESEIKRDLGYNVTTHVDPIEVDNLVEKKKLEEILVKVLKSIDKDIVYDEFRIQETAKKIYILFTLKYPKRKYSEDKLLKRINRELSKVDKRIEAQIVFES